MPTSPEVTRQVTTITTQLPNCGCGATLQPAKCMRACSSTSSHCWSAASLHVETCFERLCVLGDHGWQVQWQTCFIEQLCSVALGVDLSDLSRPPAAVIRPVQLQPLLLQLWLDVSYAQQHLPGRWLLPCHICKCNSRYLTISRHLCWPISSCSRTVDGDLLPLLGPAASCKIALT